MFLMPPSPALSLAPAAPSITSHRAASHPMRYFLALPAGWTPARSWPVLVVIPDAHRDFRENLARFMAARYHGEAPAFLTGWEAGGHTVWPLLFRHPRWWRGVFPVSSNYQGRWMDEASFSRDPARARVPVRVLFCGAPEGGDAAGLPFWRAQTQQAMDTAAAHGFTDLTFTSVPGRPHGNLAAEVFAAMDALLGAPGPSGATP